MAINRSTVFSRFKKNGGFMTGPNHATLGSADGMAKALKGMMGAPASGGVPDAGAQGDESMSSRNPDMPVKEDDQEDSPGGGQQAAPNYRKADSMSDCGGCIHFDKSNAECERFQFVTKPDMVCDDYKPQGDTMNGDSEMQDATPPDAAMQY